VFGCLGDIAISNRRSDPIPTLELSNLYNNSQHSNWSVLYGENYGMSVKHCLFFFNCREFYIDSLVQPFLVVGCVFSGAVPSSSWVSGESNIGSAVTESYAIRHLNTALCPAPFFVPIAT
jgi:hypothetical protein